MAVGVSGIGSVNLQQDGSAVATGSASYSSSMLSPRHNWLSQTQALQYLRDGVLETFLYDTLREVKNLLYAPENASMFNVDQPSKAFGGALSKAG